MLQPEGQREEVLQSNGLSEASLRLSSGWTAEAEMPLRGTSPIRPPLYDMLYTNMLLDGEIRKEVSK